MSERDWLDADTYQLWARHPSEAEPSLRAINTRRYCESEAGWIARQSGDDGAMSVFIIDPDGEMCWAAGEAARS